VPDTPHDAAWSPFFIGRQPIFDTRLEVDSYELLFRATESSSVAGACGDQATSVVLVGACLEMGLERLVGPHRAFVNLTRPFLTGEYPLPAGPEHLVLEVLETVEVDAELLAGLKRLRELGYQIALDDFEATGPTARLLPLAHIVKVDCRAAGGAELERLVRSLSGRGLRLLAEKVETREEFEHCRQLGFELFQGYFLERPTVIEGKQLGPSRTKLLKLLAEIYSEDADVDRIQQSVSADLALSYRLLRYINSAAFGLSRPLRSVREAVVYLGLARVRNLVTLFLLGSVDEKPAELVRTAMLRGRMCELLARSGGRSAPDGYFTVGLFSCLDALLDSTMDDLLSKLPLAPGITDALRDRGGDLGDVLQCVMAYERGAHDAGAPDGVERTALAPSFVAACEWVDALAAADQA
jgi:EAL and modified HD-GYP domain-containing signal transduction protein